jgi:methyl-accepting chemotaxis protein
MIVISVIGILSITKVSKELTESYYERLFKVNSLVINADRDFYQALVAQQNMIKLDIDVDELKKNKEDLDKNIQQVREETKSAAEILLTDKITFEEYKHEKSGKSSFEIFDEFNKNFNNWLTHFNISNGQITDLKGFNESFSAARDNLKQLGDILELYAGVVDEENAKKMDYLRSQYIMISVISIIMTLFFGALIANDSRKVLNKIKELAERLSNYDFSLDIDVQRKDEYGKTALALNTAQKNVREMINSIINDSEKISASSEELSATVQEMTSKLDIISNSTKEINYALQETSATAEEMSTTIEEVNSGIALLSAKALDGTENSLTIRGRASSVQQESKSAISNIKKVYTDKERVIIKTIEEGQVVNGKCHFRNCWKN